MRRLPATIVLALTIGALVPACAALRDDMGRAESLYDASQYDESLVWLADLEDDAAVMDHDMMARFYYLRGMTAFRLGKRDDALHFLALAREVAGDRGDGLRPEWKQAMDRTLVELTPSDASAHARQARQQAP